MNISWSTLQKGKEIFKTKCSGFAWKVEKPTHETWEPTRECAEGLRAAIHGFSPSMQFAEEYRRVLIIITSAGEAAQINFIRRLAFEALEFEADSDKVL